MPQIISGEQFMEVQKKMNGRKNGAQKSKQEYLLSGLVYCSSCGSLMTGNARKNSSGTLYISYECSGRKQKNGCTMRSIGKDILEDCVMDALETKLFSPDGATNTADVVMEYMAARHTELPAEVQHLKKQLEEVQQQTDNIVKAIAAGAYHSSLNSQLSHLQDEDEDLETRYKKAVEKLWATTLPKEKLIEYLTSHSNVKQKRPEDIKKIFQTFVASVTVHPDRVEIKSCVDMNGCGGGI
jgi:site-specific DNA recombinase